ncbi:MAG: hypothetical protein V3U87_06555 [Methylococcaceae bacterium]
MDLLILIKDLVISTLMAGFLVYIAYQQLETNRNKLKLDLYTKRFEVYSVSLKFYQELSNDGASRGLVREFIEKKEAAKFLFSTDPSIYLLLNEMHDESFKINAFKKNPDDQKNSPELMELIAKESLEAVKWFDPAIKNLSQKMEAFLNV